MQGLFLVLCQNNILHVNHSVLLPVYLLGESVCQLPAWFLYNGWNYSPYGKNPTVQGSIKWQRWPLRIWLLGGSLLLSSTPAVKLLALIQKGECCNKNHILKWLQNGVHKIKMTFASWCGTVFQEIETDYRHGKSGWGGMQLSHLLSQVFGGQFSLLL